MGISFTLPMGFLFTIALAIQLTISIKWLSAFKMDKMVTRGRLSIHLQEASKLSKEWGEGHTVGTYTAEKTRGCMKFGRLL